MAVYYGNSTLNSNYRGRLEFTETTNVANNTSTISWTFKVFRSDGYNSPYDRSTSNHFTLTVDGSQIYSNTDFRAWMGSNGTSEATANTWCSGSFTITHNADGAKSFSFSAKYWNTASDSIGSSSSPLTVSSTHTCTTIPRASSVSAANATLGNAMTITVNRASTSFTHTLSYSFGSSSGTIATGVGASYSWTPAKSLASAISNSKTGTCTITCTTYNGSTAIGTATTTCTLTIPTSTVSASNVNMGSATTISVSRAASNITHTLTYAFGNTSGPIASSVGTSQSWTPALTLANQIPNAKTGACTITCTSYNGTATIGSSTTTITLTVPSSQAGPTLSVSTAPGGNFSSTGKYVKGQKCVLTFTASGQYGASISSRTVNSAVVTSPYSATISSSGSVSFVCAVTDSRGYTTQVTKTISALDYATPSISPYSVFRCDSAGEADGSGTYIKITCSASYSSVDGENFLTVSYRYREAGGSWSSYTTITSPYSVVFGAGAIATTHSYDVEVRAVDSIGSTYTVSTTVPTEAVTLHLRPGGDGVGIGAYAETANSLLINKNWLVDMGKSRSAYGQLSWNTGYGGGNVVYLRIATVKILETYVSAPIKFEIFRRGDIRSVNLYLRYVNANSTDPAIHRLVYEDINGTSGNTFNAFATKTATSTWDIYVQKTESYDDISIVTTVPQFMMTRVEITYAEALLSSIPSGATLATPMYTVVQATRANAPSGYGDYCNYYRIGNTVIINFAGGILGGTTDMTPIVTGLPEAIIEAFGSLLNTTNNVSYAVSMRGTTLVARATLPTANAMYWGQVIYFAKA